MPVRKHLLLFVDVMEAEALRRSERGVSLAHHHMWWAAPPQDGRRYEEWWPECVGVSLRFLRTSPDDVGIPSFFIRLRRVFG